MTTDLTEGQTMSTRTATPTVTCEALLALCHAAHVPMDRWTNRDTAGAHRQLGEAWALLRSGAPFMVHEMTDDQTWWVDITFDGFAAFEYGRASGNEETELFYIPTRKRLDDAKGGDWY